MCARFEVKATLDPAFHILEVPQYSKDAFKATQIYLSCFVNLPRCFQDWKDKRAEMSRAKRMPTQKLDDKEYEENKKSEEAKHMDIEHDPKFKVGDIVLGISSKYKDSYNNKKDTIEKVLSREYGCTMLEEDAAGQMQPTPDAKPCLPSGAHGNGALKRRTEHGPCGV